MKSVDLVALAAMAGAVPAFGAVILPPNYADSCILQSPSAITVQAGTTTPPIYGRVYEPNMTETAGAGLFVVGQLGVGPAGSNPLTDSGWTWAPAAYHAQVGTSDEYSATLTPLTPGTYAYTYRFAVDGGLLFTVADLDGNGTAAGLSFSPAQLGTLNVTPVPEPASAAAVVAGSVVAARGGRRPRRA